MASDFARKIIKAHEGLKLKPYRCSSGKLTIGYGRNLDDRGITVLEANELFENDIIEAEMALGNIFGLEIFKESERRIAALLDMALRYGTPRQLRKGVRRSSSGTAHPGEPCFCCKNYPTALLGFSRRRKSSETRMFGYRWWLKFWGRTQELIWKVLYKNGFVFLG